MGFLGKLLRSLIFVPILVMAVGCGDGQDGGGGATDSECTPGTFGDEVARVRRLVRVEIPCPEESAEVGGSREIPGGTLVAVDATAGQSGEAGVTFGEQGHCDVVQERLDKVARLRTRSPGTALFRLINGKAYCSLLVDNLKICDATVEVTAASQQQFAQGRMECDPDPVMNVAVYSGSMTVELASGEVFDLVAGDELSQFPEPNVHDGHFDDDEINRFAEQRELLGVEIGTDGQTSPPPPPGSPPENVELPSISWEVEFETAVASTGSWNDADPDGFSYQWLGGCDSEGNNCVPVEGATARSYQPRYNEDCHYVRVVVVATNDFGSAEAVSDPFSLNCID